MARSRSSWVFFLCIVMVILTIGIVLVVREDWLVQALERERLGVHSLLGPQRAMAAEDRAYGWYRRLFIETGAVSSSLSMFGSPTGGGDVLEQGLEKTMTWLEERVRVLWRVVFQALYRVSITLSWWPFLVLTWAPFIVDALVRRRILRDSFSHSSPTLQALGFRSMVAIVALSPILLVVPVTLPPALIPWLIFLFCLAQWYVVGHFTKRY